MEEGDKNKCFIMHLELIFKIDVFMQKVERLESATADKCPLPE